MTTPLERLQQRAAANKERARLEAEKNARIKAARSTAAEVLDGRNRVSSVGDPNAHMRRMLASATRRRDQGQSVHTTDVRRITNLALQFPMQSRCGAFTDEHLRCPEHGVMRCCHGTELDEFCKANLKASAYQSGFRYREPQARALREFQGVRGALVPIGVGQGKTLAAYSIANWAHRQGDRKIILFVPSHVIFQTAFADADWARGKIPFPAPVMSLGGLPRKKRKSFAKSGRRGIYVIPYSQLSTPDAMDLLRWIEPDLVIGDEIHKLANHTAARTRRFSKYMDHDDHPTPDLVGLSGTMTRKSLHDYAHLARWALGTDSPIPLDKTILTDWAIVLDSQADAKNTNAGELSPLVTWAQRRFPREQVTFDRSGFRKAFNLRLNSAPGVAASGDADLGTSIYMDPQYLEVPDNYPGWPELQGLIDTVKEEWLTPNGDEIDHAIHTFKWLYELSMGGYYQLTWPTCADVALRRQIAELEAQRMLELAQDHHEAHQDYNRELRPFLLEHHLDGLDTPFLVGSHFHQHMAHGERLMLPERLYTLWATMKVAEEAAGGKDRVERDQTFIRVCDFKLVHGAKLAEQRLAEGHKQKLKYPGNISWLYHKAFAKWAFDLYRQRGLDPLHCPAGPEFNKRILSHKNWNRAIIASLSAHGEGKNLQGMRYAQTIQWPRSALAAEQHLGRIHRVGQEADEVTFPILFMTEFDELCFAACLNDALYLQQTLGQQQKIVTAGYTRMPRIFPPEVLRERGMHDAHDIDFTELEEKFTGMS
jgi:hypothetical protein